MRPVPTLVASAAAVSTWLAPALVTDAAPAGAPSEAGRSLPGRAAAICERPYRDPDRYVVRWRFLTGSSGDVRGRFGRVSWAGTAVDVEVAAGYALDLCAGTRGGGIQFSQEQRFTGPRTAHVDIGDPIDMVGFGAVHAVPSSVTSGL